MELVEYVARTAKAWAALLGGIVTAVLAAMPNDPEWLVIVAAVLTSVAVWAVPNAQLADGGIPGHAPEGPDQLDLPEDTV